MSGRARTGPATRAALLDAAVAAVVAGGWTGAGVRDIAARAGVPVGGIHYHFGGREALLLEATMGRVAHMFATPAAAIATAPTADALVDTLLSWAHAAEVAPVDRTLLLEVMAAARRDPSVTAALNAALGGYREAVAAALTRIGVPDGDVAGLAAGLVAHADGLWLHELLEPGFPGAAASTASVDVWRRRLATAITHGSAGTTTRGAGSEHEQLHADRGTTSESG